MRRSATNTTSGEAKATVESYTLTITEDTSETLTVTVSTSGTHENELFTSSFTATGCSPRTVMKNGR